MPPWPTYPTRAAEQGIEGECDVRFNVSREGKPYLIQASCTDPLFKREAERAVQKVEFVPKICNGKAVERLGVVYPLSFRLQD